jgi:hypothetical protein
MAHTLNAEEKAKYIESLKGKKVVAEDKCKDIQKNIQNRERQIEKVASQKEQLQSKRE